MEKGPTNNPRAVRAEQSSHEGNPLDVVKGREQEIGPLLGIFIILILFLAGASYFLIHELKGSLGSSPTATTTEIVIYRHAPISTSTETTATSTGNSRAVRAEQSSHEGNAELDSIQNSLDSQTQNINGLNF
jgi:hypothetical protein